MMDHDRRSRLFRLKLKFFTQLNVDARRIEQFKKLRLVFEIRTRRIAKTEPRALITLAKQLIKILRIRISDAQFLTNMFVPVLRQRFGAFDAQPVEIKIVGVVVSLEKLLRIFAGP